MLSFKYYAMGCCRYTFARTAWASWNASHVGQSGARTHAGRIVICGEYYGRPSKIMEVCPRSWRSHMFDRTRLKARPQLTRRAMIMQMLQQRGTWLCA
eukprot:7559432-Pyramimonas_sp.AAC.1